MITQRVIGDGFDAYVGRQLEELRRAVKSPSFSQAEQEFEAYRGQFARIIDSLRFS